jgi:hypothetical protein
MTIRGFLRSFALAGLICTSVGVSGCGRNPFQLNWTAQPDTSLIYSLQRPEINLPSGFDFVLRLPIEIQRPGSTGQWDVLLDTEGGELVIRSPRFYNIASDARVAVFENMSFDQVLKAPRDTLLYISDQSIPVRLGTTYVIQTHQSTDRFGQRCRFYAKMEPLALDLSQGTMEFVYDKNPLCEDLDLVPPDDGN